jgi:hypothetical protein
MDCGALIIANNGGCHIDSHTVSWDAIVTGKFGAVVLKSSKVVDENDYCSDFDFDLGDLKLVLSNTTTPDLPTEIPCYSLTRGVAPAAKASRSRGCDFDDFMLNTDGALSGNPAMQEHQMP